MNRVKDEVMIDTAGALRVRRSACILLAGEGGNIINLASICGVVGTADLPLEWRHSPASKETLQRFENNSPPDIPSRL